MDKQEKIGLYLYQKNEKNQMVLRDLISIFKKNSSKKTLLFFYVEANSSLHQELTLWENLQLVTGSSHWKEFCQISSPEIINLIHLIKDTRRKTSQSTPMEKFIISFIQGFHQKENLLIDLNEDLLDFELIKQLKEIFLKYNQNRQYFLASANSGLWIDCAHSLYTKEGNQFMIQELNSLPEIKSRAA